MQLTQPSSGKVKARSFVRSFRVPLLVGLACVIFSYVISVLIRLEVGYLVLAVIPGVPVLLWWISFPLHSLFMITFVDFGLVSTLVERFVPLSILRLVEFPAILCWMITMVRRKGNAPLRLWKSTPLRLLLLFGLLTLMSTFWALDRTIAFWKALEFAEMIVLTVMTATLVRTRKDIETFLWVMTGIVIVVGVLAIPSSALVGGSAARVTGGGTSANALSMRILLPLPFCVLVLLSRTATPFRRSVAVVAILCILIVSILTQSRGGIVTLFCLWAGVLVVLARWRKYRTLLAVVGSTLLLVAYTTTYLPEEYRERALTIVQILRTREISTDTQSLSRSIVYEAGVDTLRDNWVRGVGYGNFPFAFATEYGFGYLLEVNPDGMSPHNDWLRVGSELGIGGLLIWLGFVASVLRLLGSSIRWAHLLKDRHLQIIAWSVALTFGGLLVRGLLRDTLSDRVVFIFVGVVLAVHSVTRRELASARSDSTTGRSQTRSPAPGSRDELRAVGLESTSGEA